MYACNIIHICTEVDQVRGKEKRERVTKEECEREQGKRRKEQEDKEYVK